MAHPQWAYIEKHPLMGAGCRNTAGWRQHLQTSCRNRVEGSLTFQASCIQALSWPKPSCGALSLAILTIDRTRVYRLGISSIGRCFQMANFYFAPLTQGGELLWTLWQCLQSCFPLYLTSSNTVGQQSKQGGLQTCQGAEGFLDHCQKRQTLCCMWQAALQPLSAVQERWVIAQQFCETIKFM